jgi:hypothetical protein
MPARIFRSDDVHVEIAGIIPLGPIPHLFEAMPAATQTSLAVAGNLLLCKGDGFDHVGASHHQPQAGTVFANPAGVTKKGRFTAAGQSVLFINKMPVMTLAGNLETCSDAARETTCDAAVLLADVPPLFVDGSPVLPGN